MEGVNKTLVIQARGGEIIIDEFERATILSHEIHIKESKK
jgi:hypothetical protein